MLFDDETGKYYRLISIFFNCKISFMISLAKTLVFGRLW
ncbi:putative membrane protein [Vibrio anguillarum]|nr:putative membrane protein [Vibrio anguillarum]